MVRNWGIRAIKSLKCTSTVGKEEHSLPHKEETDRRYLGQKTDRSEREKYMLLT